MILDLIMVLFGDVLGTPWDALKMFLEGFLMFVAVLGKLLDVFGALVDVCNVC